MKMKYAAEIKGIKKAISNIESCHVEGWCPTCESEAKMIMQVSALMFNQEIRAGEPIREAFKEHKEKKDECSDK
jgi:hypothetical protein